jgi:hypothetical protein
MWFGDRLRVLRAAGQVRLDDLEVLGLAAALEGIEADAIDLFGSPDFSRAARSGSTCA